ncbi:MAG: deoxyribose-phosphate aldolase [Deltaproteobacteria bacterium]|nr:deoxyribose-phosphate aldolase [Deltaproteobacteria bacterium]
MSEKTESSASKKKEAQKPKKDIRSKKGPLDLAPYMDHTILKPEATEAEVKQICQEAIDHNFKAVCVNSANVALAAELLKNHSSMPIAVVGFPLGAAISSSKAHEAKEAVKAGAQEIDMVINIGALKARNYRKVLADIQTVVDAAAPCPVKGIIETGSLNQDEKIVACALAKAAGAQFVKTSTGFAAGGATTEDIALMRRVVGDEMGIKASGGIKTREDALKMIEAGATRIGASSSIGIVSIAEDQKKP